MSTGWICSQLGAREKYAIPRAIRKNGNLAAFYTDMWIKPGSLLARLKRLNGRYHPDLKDVAVRHFTREVMLHKFRERMTGRAVATDSIYDTALQHMLRQHQRGGRTIFFGYSYSSRLSMRTAKHLGYKTILGQINPGPAEADIVRRAFSQYRNGRYKATVPDEQYWDLWREEVDCADKIIVNSLWSRQLLTQAGIPAEKCVLVPLAYEPGEAFDRRITPKTFDFKSPLKLLYLGGIGIRKGFHVLVEAMHQMVRYPVHVDVVGVLKGPGELTKDLPSNLTLHRAVPASEVGKYYKAADMLIFPTLSDGFGLTQLEAQSYRLPLITSRYCAQVITDGVNGLTLQEVDARNIKEAVLKIIDQPELLKRFAANAVSMNDYSLEKLSNNLAALE